MISSIKKTWQILTLRERRAIVPLLFCMLIGAMLESLSVALVVPALSVFLIPGAQDGFWHRLAVMFFSVENVPSLQVLFVLGLILIFLLKNAFLLFQVYFQNVVNSRIRERVQNLLLRYYLSKRYAFFLQSDSGDILRTITVDSDYFFALLNHYLNFFSDAIVVIALLTALFCIHPRLSLLSVVLMAAEYGLVARLIRPRLRKSGRRYREALGRGNSLVFEVLRGIKTIKISGTEEFFETRYAMDVQDLTRSRLVEKVLQSVPGRLMESLTIAVFFSVLMVFISSGWDVVALLPVFSAFFLATLRILPGISRMSSSISYIAYYEGTLQRVHDICVKDPPAVLEFTGENPPAFSREIRLEGICYRYPEREADVLRDISCRIPYCRTVGIQGASGEGKTTLIDILLGLLTPQAGQILLDDQPEDTAQREWQRLFAYIPQQPFLLRGTIRDNILFGQEETIVNDERIWEALDAARLADFVQSLPQGLLSPVNEAGINLSGGQIQRLCIARAIFSRAPILVFDEATSSLDEETEKGIIRTLTGLRGKRTIVIVSHRPATLENCDLLYEIKDGTLREVGRAF